MMAVLPNSFLGGSAPRLRFLTLRGIPFPGLPKLLLSATHLTNLHLICVPHSGYFPPEAMVTVLSRLTSLESLDLAFQSPPSLPDRATRRPPPPKRFVLPVLTYFGFKGVGEYLDGLVVRIDAPLLERLDITFFNQILFDTPQLIQFITRTSALMTPETARVYFGGVAAMVSFLLQAVDYPYLTGLNFEILYETSDWQISCLEQVCTWCSPLFFRLGGPLHFRESLFATISARQHREHAMAATIATVRHCEESLLIQGVRATYYAFPARACRGKDDRSVAQPAEYFLGGAGDVRTCPGRHSAVRCQATSQSPHSGFSLGQTELVQKFDG